LFSEKIIELKRSYKINFLNIFKYHLISRTSEIRQPGNVLAKACLTASSAAGSGRSAVRTGKILQMKEIEPASNERIDRTATKAMQHINISGSSIVIFR
jgi:hypothetical protein